MAVITLSWQYGCLGDQVAQNVAGELGYTIVGKQEIHAMLVNSTGNASKELEADTAVPTAGEELEPRFFQRLHRQHSSYTNLFTSFIYRTAGQDRAIIKGYGANMILTSQSHVFRVRLKGSVDTRIAMLQQHKQLDRHTAEQLVKKEDRARVEFIQYVFKQEFTDTRQYDLVIDIKKPDLSTITEMIVHATRALDSKYPLNTGERRALNVLALTHEIRAIAQRKAPGIKQLDVQVDDNDTVMISGNVAKAEEKQGIEQQIRSLSGVQNVVNALHIR